MSPSTGYDAPQPTGNAMKRRSRAGGKPIKGRRRKTPEPKRRNAPKAVPGLNSSAAEEVRPLGLTRELSEAREQQTATSEVLKVICSSPGDLQPVFATMLEKAVRICDAKFGNIYRWDGNTFHLMASHNIRQPTRVSQTFRVRKLLLVV